MTTKVQILPTLECIPGRDAPTFGLTLAAELVGDRPQWDEGGARPDLLRALLRPWSWDGSANGQVTVELTGVRFFHADWSEAGAVRPDRPDPIAGWEPLHWDLFRGRLDRRFEAFRRQETPTAHPWGRGQGDRPVDPRMRPWPTFLAEISVLPRPIPQQLGLSRRLVNDAVAPGSRVAAAPVLRVIVDGWPHELIPSPTPSAEDPCFETMTFVYLGAEGLGIDQLEIGALTALCDAEGVRTDDCTTFLDLQTLWVRRHAGALSGVDWRRGLEERLTQAVDEARHTIDAVRKLAVANGDAPSGTPEQPGKAGCGERIAKAALVSLDALRRMSTPGEPKPDAACQPPQSFLLRALRWLEADMEDPSVFGADRGFDLVLRAGDWLERKVARKELTPKARLLWASSLSQVLRPPADGVPAVPAKDDPKALAILATLKEDLPIPALALLPTDQVLAELDEIYATVTRPAGARALVEVLWRLAMSKAAKWPADPADAEHLRELIAKLPAHLDVARELARDRAARDRGWMLDDLRKVDRAKATSAPTAGEPLVASFAATDEASRRAKRAVDEGTWTTLEPGAEASAFLAAGGAPDRLDPTRATFLAESVRRMMLPEEEAVQAPLAEGISLQVDTVDGDPERLELRGERCQDLLRHLQGVVMFVRFQEAEEDPEDEAAWSGWYCLNHAAADLGVRPSLAVLVPSRIGYQGGLRAPVLTYDGEPLTVGGPLAHDAVAGASLSPGVPGAANGSSELDEPLIQLSYLRGATMPGLAFARKFQTAACIVTNSGEGPIELPHLEPGEQRLPIDPGRVSCTFHYFRNTPVGALGDDLGCLRCEQPSRDRDAECQSPSDRRLVPDGFAPRCHEIPLEALLDPSDPVIRQQREAAARAEAAGAATGAAPPEFPLRVALLASPELQPTAPADVHRALQFELSLPTAPLKVWERWIGYDEPEKPRLKFVRRSYEQRRQAHQRAVAAGCADPCVSLEDLGIYLTDPAVVGVAVRLVKVVEAGGSVGTEVVGEHYEEACLRRREQPDYAAADPASPLSLESEQRMPVCVTVQPRQEGGIAVWVNEKLRLVGDGEGLYRLTAYAVLAPGAEDRFGVPGTGELGLERPDEVVCHDGGGHCLTSPWHLMVEIAEPLPTGPDVEDALWRALSVSPAAAQGVLDVQLDLLQPCDGERAELLRRLRRHVVKADLHQQSWEWQGRPPARHPDLPPVEACSPKEREEKLLAFEMSELGGRGDEDARARPMVRGGRIEVRDGTGKVDERKTRRGSWPDLRFGLREDLNTLEPRPDGRALHHRFGVRVFSRYAVAMPPNTAFLDGRCHNDSLKWHRAWVPARHLVELPRPDVRLVLPLTGGDPAGHAAGSGFLVACGGGWYELGGLAEDLEIEVVDILAPDVPTEECDDETADAVKCERHFQAGTDPIYHVGGVLDELELPATGRWRALSTKHYAIRFDGVLGGIGHHRGLPPHGGRFDLTSFVVPPPAILARADDGQEHPIEADLAWWFLKLQWRRRLRIAGDGGRTARSEPTSQKWVQLLPAINRIEEDWFEAGGAGVEPILAGDRLVPGPADGFGAARSRFELVALMTERVHDAAGRGDQEAFLGLWWRAGNSWITDATTLAHARRASATRPMDRLLVRWLEVQSRRDPLALRNGPELWRRLFDLDVADADRARIVRMSRPHVVAVEGS